MEVRLGVLGAAGVVRMRSGRPGADGAPLDGCWVWGENLERFVLVVVVGWVEAGAMRRDCEGGNVVSVQEG